MKIGFLHSVKLHLGSIANAKLYRIHYKDWKDNPYWLGDFYGQHTDRSEERGLIYDYRAYKQEFADFDDYDLIALSLNFDHYPDDFHKFVTSVINDLYKNYPILYQKEVIILAGNEVYEKRRSAEKVIQTTWDTAQGIKNSMKNLPICCWNQSLPNSEQKQAFSTILSNQVISQICKYIGFQSLGTRACDIATYIRYIKNMGYEPIDVECGHISPLFGTVKELFNISRNNGVKKLFFIAPYISEELKEFSRIWEWYALQVGNNPKDKHKIIKYVQEFKDKKEVINEMWDDIIFNRLYKEGSKGIGVIRIQRIYNLWIDHYDWSGGEKPLKIETNGVYNATTVDAVRIFQKCSNLLVDGMAGKQTMTELLKFLLDRVEYYK